MFKIFLVFPSIPPSALKTQLHWASLLATRLLIYSLLLNSLCVITLSCKLAARSASTSKVEGWATCWRFYYLASKLAQCNSALSKIV
jgi:hypothetical protein